MGLRGAATALWMSFVAASLYATESHFEKLEFKEIRGKEGFWRVAKDSKEVWWFLRPDTNRPEFMNTVTTVQPLQRSRVKGAPYYRSQYWKLNPADEQNTDLVKTALTEWAANVVPDVFASGFKGLGAWCNPILHHFDIPMSRDLNIFASLHHSLSQPEWKIEAEKLIRERVQHLKDNKNLVGYFSDNELPWEKLKDYADDYFTTVSSLIRKYDANHLYMGVRYKSPPPRSVLRASRGNFDVQSLNFYSNGTDVPIDVFQTIYEVGGSPILITEYGYHSKENRSGSRNFFGFANGEVLNQGLRSFGYEQMTQSFAGIPYVIGADWFQWNDEPPNGRDSDGEDVNFGTRDIEDRPYEELIATIVKTTPLLNPLHQASSPFLSSHAKTLQTAFNKNENIFFISKTDTSSSPQKINLKLDAPRISETDPRPYPELELKWHPEGLILTGKIHSPLKPQNEYAWWKGDAVEFWIQTQAQNENPPETYDSHSHQFFIVPDRTGSFLQAGQWHRYGDALKETLFPIPQLKIDLKQDEKSYEFSAFFPKSVFQSLDLKEGSQIRFNFNISESANRRQFYFSASKAVATELNPSTWAVAQLIH